jgi:hypothetical protein
LNFVGDGEHAPRNVSSESSASRGALSTLAECPLCLQYRPNLMRRNETPLCANSRHEQA